MQLLKPHWIAQEGHPIFSIDVHPDGTRFATGGQGKDSGRISIWNLRPVLSQAAAEDPSVPKLLSQMDHHMGCVNCLRWSNSGSMLASGGDDKLVMIWKKSAYGGGGAIFGEGDRVNVESWRLVHTLRSHDGDILDLAWAPQDSLLATASVDNTIIVWNGADLSESLVRLKGHTGLVKGVVFDPVGKYLASQSDDRTLRVWRLSDWKQETVIKEPFKECGATTHVLRPGWSPDGTMVVSAHAMNGGGPTAQIIERKKWTTHKDFVGHKKAISCVRFNRQIFEKTRKGKTEMFVMAALGSRDRSFSVWCTNLKRPLCVIGDIFDQSVLDLAWSRDGRVLLACSMDGSVAAAVFKPDEIGRPVAEDKVAQLMSVQYGKQYGQTVEKKKKPTNGSVFVENPELLLKQQSNLSCVSNGTPVAAAKETKSAPKGPTDKQIEARTVDGKRRITPIFIPPPSAETLEQSQPFGSGQFGSSSTQLKSKIEIEKRDVIVKPNVSPEKLSDDSNKSNSTAATTAPIPKSSTSIPTNVLVAKSAPTQTGHAKGSPASPVKGPPPSATVQEDTEPPVNIIQVRRKPSRPIADSSDEEEVAAAVKAPEAPASEAATSAPHAPAVRKLEPAKRPRERPDLMSLKRGHTFPEEDDEESLTARPKKKGRPSSPSGSTGRPEEDEATPVDSAHEDTNQTAVAAKALGPAMIDAATPLLKRRRTERKQVFDFNLDGQKFEVTVENHAQALPAACGSLSYMRGTHDNKAWEVLLPSPICAMELSQRVLLASNEDQSLNLFSTSGKRLAPPIMVPGGTLLSAVSKRNHLAIVTCAAKFYLWAVLPDGGLRVEYRNECLVSLLEGRVGNTITKLTFSALQDEPVVVTRTGSSFIFSKLIGSWMKIGQARHGLQSISCYSCHVPNVDPERPAKTPLAMIHALTPTPAHVENVNVDIQVKANIAFCEAQKLAALYLSSPEEYRYWLVREVLHLSKLENTDRLRSLFDDLLGPGFESPTWESEILGVEKRKLLKFALKVIAANPQLQRLHMEYQSQISNDIQGTKDEVSGLLGI